MTILAALVARYNGQATRGEAAHVGFGPARIAFCLVLDLRGRLMGVEDLRTKRQDGFRTPAVIAPEAPMRTSAIISGTFWDKTSYVLGRTRLGADTTSARQEAGSRRAALEHAAFVARHEALLRGHDDPAFESLLAFLRAWRPDEYDKLPRAAEMLGLNLCFRLEGDLEYLHDRAASRAVVAAAIEGSPDSSDQQCLATGSIAPIARLHPAIRGVPGSLPTGGMLVSFNLGSSASYGKTRGANAPVSEAAVRAYSAALTELIWAKREDDPTDRQTWTNRVQLSDLTLLFWADAASSVAGHAGEALVATLLDVSGAAPRLESRQTAQLQQLLEGYRKGRPLVGAAPALSPLTRFQVLGLRPTMARLSVRFWYENTLGELFARFREHWEDLRLDPPPQQEAPSIGQLLFELTPQRRYEDMPVQLAPDLLRSILTGAPFPRALLTRALMRVRAERKTTPLRTALIKACLARDARKGLAREGAPVSLDRDELNKGYRLGRLFAVIDAAQWAGLGRVRTRVRDKFFGAASATPGRVFPYLLRGARDHLASARGRGWGGRATSLDREISQIMDGLGAAHPFPAALGLADQGRFVVGFYHESAAVWPRTSGGASDESSEEIDAGEPSA